jgi:hypothetical protein
MRLVTFLLVSIFEWASLLILTFSIFMFKIKDNRVNIVFSAALLSMFSYIIRDVANMTTIAPFLQLLIVFLIFWKLIRIPAIYAAIMASFGYICYVFIQIVIMMILNLMSQFSIETLVFDYMMNYLTGSMAACISLIISYFLVRNRLGFSFIPDHPIKIGLRGHGMFIIQFVLVAATLAMLYFSSQQGFFQWLFLAMAVITGLSLYLLVRKETGK